MKFHIVQVVWGDAFVNLLLDVALPCQLSPGNLPVFRDSSHQVTYKIYTTANGQQQIDGHPILLQLRSIMPVEFIWIDHIINGSGVMSPEQKYHALSECHRMAIDDARKDEARLVFVSPDCMQSDGTFAHLLNLAESGKRAVVMSSLRVVKETFVPALRSGFRNADGTIRISSRDTVKLACKNWHPLSKTLFVDATPFNSAASHLYWNVPQEGVLARCFHLSVLMVVPGRTAASFSTTIDGDYLLHEFPNIDDIHVVEDSDDIMCLEISSGSYSLVEDKIGKFSPFRVARRMNTAINPQHRAFFVRRIRFHINDVSDQWHDVDQRSDRAVSSVLGWLRSGRMFLWNPKTSFRKLLVGILGEHSTKQLIRWSRSLAKVRQ